MSITLELPPDIEARLIAQASAHGMSVEELLKVTVDNLLTTSEQSSSAVLSPQERAEKFVNWARSHSIKTPPLSDEAISRESIYREREDSQR
ncbi:MAG: hypothetical protein IGS49_05970 [Chlorogloeopsis fritschii C42_A2020_084]|nr:hypothetical protein [Chlorogloeopsis fritschii C42_A2020_084]